MKRGVREFKTKGEKREKMHMDWWKWGLMERKIEQGVGR